MLKWDQSREHTLLETTAESDQAHLLCLASMMLIARLLPGRVTIREPMVGLGEWPTAGILARSSLV